MSRFKAAIFDIDGTLTEQTSWTALSRDLAAAPEPIFTDFSNKKAGYGAAKAQLLELWAKSKDANRAHLEKVFSSWPLRDDAPEVIRTVKRLGLRVCLISGSIDLYAEEIAERLTVFDWYANAHLRFKPDGTLQDFDFDSDQAGKKREQLTAFCNRYGFSASECAAVGDSSNDSGMFELTGHGILVEGDGATDELRAKAWKRIASLSGVPALLE